MNRRSLRSTLVRHNAPRWMALFMLVASAGAVGCGDDDAAGPGGTGATGAGGSGATGAGGAGASGAEGGAGAVGGGGAGAGGGAGGETTLPSLELLDPGLAVDLTPDGDIALVQDLASLEGDLYFYEVATETLTLETQLGDALLNLATGLSQTRRISAFYSVPVVAGVFTPGSGWSDIDSPFAMGCGEDRGAAWDISADGTVAVGFAWNDCSPQAFRWTDDGGDGTTLLLDVLGSSAGSSPPTNRATVVSDDGTVAAGFAQTTLVDRWPAVWNEDGSGFLLTGPVTDDTPGEILSISADGSVVAGIWGFDAFLWTEAGGHVDLGKVPNALPSDPCYPNAMTADGSMIFGGCGNPFFGIPVAFVWTETEGMRPLVDIVTASDLTVPAGYTLTSVLATSADGAVVLGVAVDELMNQKSFVLQLPASAY